MRQIAGGRRGVALAAGAGLAWLAFYGAWLALRPGGERGLVIFANTAYLAPIAAAGLLSALAARRVASSLRSFWILMASACGVWLAGEVLWAFTELQTGSVPFPWWTDAAYLAFYPLVAAALCVAFRPRIRAASIGHLVDGVLGAAALALVWWWLLIRPLDVGTDVASLVSLAYPVSNLVIISVLLSTRLLPARNGTLAMRIVACGIACGAVADALFMDATVTTGYLSGGWIELGWQAEAVLFAFAAYVAVRGRGQPAAWARFRETRELGTRALLAGTVLLALGVILAAALSDSNPPIVHVWGAALILAAFGRLLVRSAPFPTFVDPLTGTYDRDYLADQLTRLLARERHFGESFAVALVEIEGGDQLDGVAAEHVARRIVAATREVDVVARLEDGRFAVLLPNAERDEALAVAEAVRIEIARERIDTAAGQAALMVSIGVAVSTVPEDGDAIVDRAKQALAAARRLGGNQVRAGADDVILFSDRPLDSERFELIVALAKVVDAREGSDPKHSHVVASLAARLALEMGLDAEAVSRTYIAGLLHDLGKLALPEVVLQKPGPLDRREWDEMVRHSSLGASLVEKIAAVRDAAPIVAAHHERWDGAGYPNRLAGEHIPAEARIVAVTDALVAMTSERPYRAARSVTSALTTIWQDSEKRYDPAVVSALLALARNGQLKLEEPEVAAGSLVRLSRR